MILQPFFESFALRHRKTIKIIGYGKDFKGYQAILCDGNW